MPQDKNNWNVLNHPECREDEVWLTNAWPDDADRMEEYESKRIGSQAYSEIGALIEGITVPVFVSRAEYEAKNEA